MSMELGRSVLELATDDRKLDKGLKDAEKKTQGWGSRISGVAGKAALAIGGIGVAALAAGFKFAQAAAEEEAGMRRLEQAVRNTGRAVDQGFRAEIERAVTEMSEMSGFGDGELRDSLSMLVAQTGSYEEALKRQRAAMDLARGTGMDLTAASQLLGKVTDENVNVLKRYGIEAHEGATAQEVLNEVQKRFSGQAKEFGTSAAGQWQKFQNAVGDLQEEIGTLLLPAFEKFVNFAGAGVHFLRNVAVPGLTAALAELRTKGAPVFDLIGGIIKNVVMPGLQGVVRTVPLIFGSLGEIFDVLTGKRPDAGGVLRQLVGDDQAENIMAIVGRVRSTMTQAFDLVKPIIQAVIDKVSELRTKFEELPPAIQAFAGAALVAKATGVDDWLLNIVNTAATVASGVYDMSRAFAIFSTVSLVGAIKLLPTWIGLQWLSVTAGLAMVAAFLPFIALGAAIGVAVGLLIVFWDDFAASAQALGGIIGHFLGTAWKALTTAITDFFGPFRQLDALFRTDMPSAIGILLGAIVRAVPTMVATFLEFGRSVMAMFAGLFENVKTSIGELVGGALGALWGFRDDALAAVGQFVEGFFTAIAHLNYEIGPRMITIATNAVGGFIRGMFDAIPAVLRAVGQFASRFLEGLKRGLGIRSPSVLTMAMGEQLAAGMALGITRGEPLVEAAMLGLRTSLMPAELGRFGAVPSGTSSMVSGRAAAHGHAIYMDSRLVARASSKGFAREREMAGAGS